MRTVSVILNADNQIKVTLGSECRAGESYYLGLQPNSENAEFRPASGTLQLVNEWIRLLSDLPDGLQLFLPFDFSDEFTRWVTLHRTGRMAEVTFGWATIEGWAISPADLSTYAYGLPGFTPDEPMHLQTFYLPRLISDLRQSRQLLAAQAEFERIHPPMDDRQTT